MKKVRVSEATGIVLDYLVVKSKGWLDGPGELEDISDWFRLLGIDYSTDWAQAGPIIDRENIQWCRLNGQIEAWSGFDYVEWRRDWDSNVRMSDGAGFGTGHSILVAAMRCYVSSKLGDEVEVPDELLECLDEED